MGEGRNLRVTPVGAGPGAAALLGPHPRAPVRPALSRVRAAPRSGPVSRSSLPIPSIPTHSRIASCPVSRVPCHAMPSRPIPVSRVPFSVSHIPCPASRVPCPMSRVACPMPRIPCPASWVPSCPVPSPYPVPRIPCPISRVACPVPHIPYPVSRIPCPLSPVLSCPVPCPGPVPAAAAVQSSICLVRTNQALRPRLSQWEARPPSPGQWARRPQPRGQWERVILIGPVFIREMLALPEPKLRGRGRSPPRSPGASRDPRASLPPGSADPGALAVMGQPSHLRARGL